MRIKRVEIIGFKSFCDRAAGQFELCGGIDGVVVRCGDLAGGVVGKNGAGAEFVEARQGSAILAGAGDFVEREGVEERSLKACFVGFNRIRRANCAAR